MSQTARLVNSGRGLRCLQTELSPRSMTSNVVPSGLRWLSRQIGNRSMKSTSCFTSSAPDRHFHSSSPDCMSTEAKIDEKIDGVAGASPSTSKRSSSGPSCNESRRIDQLPLPQKGAAASSSLSSSSSPSSLLPSSFLLSSLSSSSSSHSAASQSLSPKSDEASNKPPSSGSRKPSSSPSGSPPSSASSTREAKAPAVALSLQHDHGRNISQQSIAHQHQRQQQNTGFVVAQSRHSTGIPDNLPPEKSIAEPDPRAKEYAKNLKQIPEVMEWLTNHCLLSAETVQLYEVGATRLKWSKEVSAETVPCATFLYRDLKEKKKEVYRVRALNVHSDPAAVARSSSEAPSSSSLSSPSSSSSSAPSSSPQGKATAAGSSPSAAEPGEKSKANENQPNKKEEQDEEEEEEEEGEEEEENMREDNGSADGKQRQQQRQPNRHSSDHVVHFRSQMTTRGSKPGPSLFGWDTVPEDANEVVITGSELDAMAVHESTRLPAISLPIAKSPLPFQLAELIRKRFSRVYLWLDDDAAGDSACQAIARTLSTKVQCLAIRTRSISKSTAGLKCAFDMHTRGMNLKSGIDAARQLSASTAMLGFADMRQRALLEYENADMLAGYQSLTLPSLNKYLRGVRPGEMTVVTGATGVGKTSIVSQLSLDYCCQGMRTLWGSFEVDNVQLIKKMMRQFARVDFSEDSSQYDLWADRFQQLPMRFMNQRGSADMNVILDLMRSGIEQFGIQHVIIDNLQFVLSGQAAGPDRWDLQDRVIAGLRAFVTSHNIHLTLISHVRKEENSTPLRMSSIIGSVKTTQEADNVILIQNVNNKRYIEVAKNRYFGTTGKFHYRYDPVSLNVYEVPEEEGSMPSEERKSRGRRFGKK